MGILSIFRPSQSKRKQHPATSVIIPTYNEAKALPRTISLLHSRSALPLEIIVADGHSQDATVQTASNAGAKVLQVRGGRAAQLNAAARQSHGPNILFLHADTAVPPGFDVELRKVLQGRNVVAGAFRLSVDSDLRGMRFVECVANLRSRLLRRPYGDQGLFMRRECFESVDGYPDLPFLDDYEMVRRLSRRGKIAVSQKRVLTSGRRWEALGVVRTTVMNQVIIGAYHIGVPVWQLRTWYRDVLSHEEGKQMRRKAATKVLSR